MRVLCHVVAFKFENLTDEDCAALSKMCDAIRQSTKAVQFDFGAIFVDGLPSGDRRKGYTHQITAMFKSLDDMKSYDACDSHQDLKKWVASSGKCADIAAFDTWLENMPQLYPDGHTMHG